MISDLDETLRKLLMRDLPAVWTGNSAFNISFAAPDKDFPPSGVGLPTVNSFLYDVRENRDLRSNEVVIERRNGTAIQHLPPVRVDASYLITAWSGAANVVDQIAQEHALLGEVMRVLLRYPRLPQEVLHGVLANQELPLPTTALQPGKLQSLGEFWQALGGKPKATLHYTVTVAVAPPAPEPGPVVLEKIIEMGLKE